MNSWVGKRLMNDSGARAWHFDGLRLIAMLKLGKAALLIAAAYGVRELLNPIIGARIYRWALSLTGGSERQLALDALDWLNHLNPQRVGMVFAITSAYTLLFAAEGLGLWFHKRWAEWLTVVATSSLIPFEIWELWVRPPGKKLTVLVALIVNLAIVAYLALQLKAARQHANVQARG